MGNMSRLFTNLTRLGFDIFYNTHLSVNMCCNNWNNPIYAFLKQILALPNTFNWVSAHRYFGFNDI